MFHCRTSAPANLPVALCPLELADYFWLRLEGPDASEYHDIFVAFLLHSLPFQSPHFSPRETIQMEQPSRPLIKLGRFVIRTQQLLSHDS